MRADVLHPICDNCCFNFKSFHKRWKLNNQNNKLFIFCVQRKLRTSGGTLDLTELIPDYAFLCNERWFVIYRARKLRQMSEKTYQNFNFNNHTLFIGSYWYRIFTNGIIKSRWYNLPRYL
ncbi:MAG: hypothetical protein EIB84_07240 [Spiroplasma poulsonii]|uniref:Uncharacterized protein n=1 Tax=Spiroplasma poulsonii TaxID=2138 RepID=A0A2P6FDP0_9MOLU|nr:hypothetical protein [Spiroplasma poulsonii]KAF0850557.1 hypothetical protein MSROBK_014330 [Spiroplasma poulsonii]MBW1242526.1 hypothetical protein [Spiroplasma poulsonii]PQM31569.1 hypothetical protein SMSRO_SF014060 [Spiroplasma poulsonii]PWF96585.1 hypothetical protein SMSE_20320 [Spiroplasma poulsonii]PWF97161.1 hypothetical protein SMH99_19700 [Spiroplasma poulsonii]